MGGGGITCCPHVRSRFVLPDSVGNFHCLLSPRQHKDNMVRDRRHQTSETKGKAGIVWGGQSQRVRQKTRMRDSDKS